MSDLLKRNVNELVYVKMKSFYFLFIFIDGWLGLIREINAIDDSDRIITTIERNIMLIADETYSNISDQIQVLSDKLDSLSSAGRPSFKTSLDEEGKRKDEPESQSLSDEGQRQRVTSQTLMSRDPGFLSEGKPAISGNVSHVASDINIASGQGAMAGGQITAEEEEIAVDQKFSTYYPASTELPKIDGLGSNTNIASGQGAMAGTKIKGKVKQTFN